MDGFAFAGTLRKDLQLVCELLVCMMRDGKICPVSWFHIFGTNHPGIGIMLTAIQRCLRRHVGNEIDFSYDSSTSFRYLQEHGQVVRGLVSDRYDIRLDSYTVAQRGYQIPGDRPFPFPSPLADRCVTSDFLPQTAPGGDRSRATDTLGQQMLSNHSVYRELTAIIQANQLFDMEHGDDWQNRDKLAIPWAIHRAVEAIKEIFRLAADGQFDRAIQRARNTEELSAYAGVVQDDDGER